MELLVTAHMLAQSQTFCVGETMGGVYLPFGRKSSFTAVSELPAAFLRFCGERSGRKFSCIIPLERQLSGFLLSQEMHLR
jgi:hypothetical protein